VKKNESVDESQFRDSREDDFQLTEEMSKKASRARLLCQAHFAFSSTEI
jgi:hypothetical protein